MSIQFTDPTRAGVKLKAGISGPTGSGKTRGALELATGLAGGNQIALINTEIDGTVAQIDRYKFLQYDFTKPFDLKKLQDGLAALKSNEYGVVIVDSLSFFWNKEGGLLDMKAAIDADPRRKNKFTNWGPITKIGQDFMDTLLNAPFHVITTFRARRRRLPRKGSDEVIDCGWVPQFREEHLFDPHFIAMLYGPEEVEFDGQKPYSFWFYKDRWDFKVEFRDRMLTADFGARIAAWLDKRPAPTHLHRDDMVLKVEGISELADRTLYYCASEVIVIKQTGLPIQNGETVKFLEPTAPTKGSKTWDNRGKQSPIFTATGWDIVTEVAE